MEGSFYQKRLSLEKRLRGERDPEAPLLSWNPKTGISINLPVLNCIPTPACARSCYACQGRISFRKSLEKALAVDRWIRERPRWAAEKAAKEAKGRPIRLNGSGDLRPEHKNFIKALLSLGAKLYGFTKRPDTWVAMKEVGLELMFSIDVTMDRKRLFWALENLPRRRLAYLRRPQDPDLSRIVYVTFPEHGPHTRNVEKVPVSRTDCPAVRRHISCLECRRCF